MKKRLLIVDDKPTIAKIINVYISELYECIYFEDPILAIAWMLEGNRPDLIITDLNMPKMSGTEFIDYVKKNDLFRNIPIVILSSEDNSLQKIALLEKGASDYISKPFNPMELKARIKKLLS